MDRAGPSGAHVIHPRAAYFPGILFAGARHASCSKAAMNLSSKVSRSYRGLASFGLLAAILPVMGCLGSSGDPANDGKLDNAVTAPGLGVDYAWARPTPASLVADGYGFVARYLSYDTTGKNLTLSEADALIAAGLDVVVVWEEGANDALSGYDLGVTEAQAAASQALACGQPPTRPIYFAIDFDATTAQQATLDEYFEGVASVIGLDRTGAYAGYGAIDGLFNDGKITWGWQTYAWSSGQWDSRAQLRQTLNDIGPDGEMDQDQSMVSDFGEWGPGSVPPITPPPPSAPTCAVAGVAGTCIETSACAAMTGYVSTAGLCAGAADIECCTPGASAPPPPASCTAGGVTGTCIATTTCAAMAGYVSTAGDCSGAAAGIECCTLATVSPPPPPPPTTCTADGVSGTCISTATCAAMAGYVSTAGDCPGAADIECCTPPPSCTANGVSGVCINTSTCASMGSTSTAGLCPGAADIECCTP
jgi:Domain of unknown function (DUF1906)